MYPQPYLQPYKGKDTRHDCPSCKAKLSFTQYLDGSTHKPIHKNVGKCNRESKCGYHYTPKQYFIDNPLSTPLRGGREGSYSSNTTNVEIQVGSLSPLSSRRGVGGEVPFRFVEKSASYKSNFVRFLCEFLTTEQITYIGDNYALGATRNKEVIFWQIDITGKVRTGKIMQYNSETGKRIKYQSGAIDWVHNKLKKSGQLPEDFNLQQCFFGEHLLTIYPNKPVAIVESEKSAIIASCIIPDLIWLAAGNINGLSIEKCQILKGRDVILYPDLGAYDKWSEKAKMLNQLLPLSLSHSPLGEGTSGQQPKELIRVRCSTLLEDEANETDRAKGLDIADYIIAELKFPLSSNSQKVHSLSPLGESPRRGIEAIGVVGEVFPEIQSCFSPTLQAMIDKNHALLILIDNLKLIEI